MNGFYRYVGTGPLGAAPKEDKRAEFVQKFVNDVERFPASYLMNERSEPRATALQMSDGKSDAEISILLRELLRVSHKPQPGLLRG